MLCIPGRQRRIIRPLSRFGFSKMKFLRNDRGAASVEFGLVALPVILFILGIMQFADVMWTDNLLQISVDTGTLWSS